MMARIKAQTGDTRSENQPWTKSQKPVAGMEKRHKKNSLNIELKKDGAKSILLGFKADYCAFTTANSLSFCSFAAIGVYFKPGVVLVCWRTWSRRTGLVLEFLLVRFYNFIISDSILPSTCCCGNAVSSKLNIIRRGWEHLVKHLMGQSQHRLEMQNLGTKLQACRFPGSFLMIWTRWPPWIHAPVFWFWIRIVFFNSLKRSSSVIITWLNFNQIKIFHTHSGHW